MTTMFSLQQTRRSVLSGGTALAAGFLVGRAGPARAQDAATPSAGSGGDEGAVFVGTNHNNTANPDDPANQVVMYRRAADGELTRIDSFATGGQGSGPGQRFAGDALGSGNSVRLSTDNRWLFVTNAGSNTVSVFKVGRETLELVDVVPTGDGSQGQRFPNSVTQHEDLVYVLNSADDGSIAGFRLSEEGQLTPIADSIRGLEANQDRFPPDALYNPAQIEFTPDGSKLVVTIKDGPSADLAPAAVPTGPGRVLVWSMDEDGLPSAGFARTDFANRGPFGFSFDPEGRLLVAEFTGGGIEEIDGEELLTAAAGSYEIDEDGALTAISAGVEDHQVDTCWLVNNGAYAYGSNYASGTVSSFTIGGDGSLELLESVAGEADDPGNAQGATPLDARISQDGRFLYVVLPGAGKVGGWRIGDDGRLTKVGEFGGLPQTVEGDHALLDFGSGGSPAGIEAI